MTILFCCTSYRHIYFKAQNRKNMSSGSLLFHFFWWKEWNQHSLFVWIRARLRSRYYDAGTTDLEHIVGGFFYEWNTLILCSEVHDQSAYIDHHTRHETYSKISQLLSYIYIKEKEKGFFFFFLWYWKLFLRSICFGSHFLIMLSFLLCIKVFFLTFKFFLKNILSHLLYLG